MADKIKFLYGSTADIDQANAGNSSYPQPTRGQVYFAIDQLNANAVNGQIYFDVPIGTGTDVKRILMSNRVNYATNASTAEYAIAAAKAVNDENNLNIADNYLSTAITVNGSTVTFVNGNGDTQTITLPNTDTKVSVTSTAGHGQNMYLLVSTATTLASNNKTFTNKVWSYTGMYLDKDSGVLSVTSTAALRADEADKATADKNGKDISAFYLSTAISLSGNTITFKNGEGTTTASITIPDLDEKLKVTSTASVGSKIYLIGNAASGLGTAGGTTTSTGIVHKDIYIDTSGRINATTTTALRASTATRAENDSNGKSIANYYLSTAVNTGTDYITLKSGSGSNGPKIPNLTMSTDGIIDIKHIPKNAIERVYLATSMSHMYSLTSTDVQNGDVVHVIDNSTTNSVDKMYFVVDDTALSSSSGYQEFAAGTAASVAWGNITGRPDDVLLSKQNSSITLTTGTSNAVIDVALKTYDTGNGVMSTLTIPGASTNVAGLVTTGSQTYEGTKTFNAAVNMTTATISKRLNYSGIGTASGNNNYYLWIASTGTKGVPLCDTTVTYNTNTKILNVVASTAKCDGSGNEIVSKYVTYTSSGAYLNTTTNVITLKNSNGDTSTAQIQNYYPSSASFSTATNAATLQIKNRSQHSSAVVSSFTVALPVATTTMAGIVTATDQTFAGKKTFNGGIVIGNSAQLKIEKDTDSAHSQDNNAAMIVEGGVTIKKQMSAKTVRVDNGQSTSGCTLTFNETQQVLSFVFQ